MTKNCTVLFLVPFTITSYSKVNNQHLKTKLSSSVNMAYLQDDLHKLLWGQS